MRNRPLVILGLLAASSMLAVFVACSSDDSAATPGSNDAGDDSATPVGDDDSGNPVNNDSGPKGDDGGGTTNNDAGDGSIGTNDAGIVVGPVAMPFPTGGSPDAIYWDATKQILYVVDDKNNQVWTWTDAARFVKYGTVPDNAVADDAGHTKLNGVAETADGTLVITRFGYGTVGAIYTLAPDGGTTTVPNVDPTRKRITVAVDPATHTIYADSFTGSGAATAGALETVDLANGTTTYATGFTKPVGLLVQGDNVIVSDQGNATVPGALYAIPTNPALIADGGASLIDGGAFPVYAPVFSPDQLSTGPNGTILTDQFQAAPDGGTEQIRQIFADGGYATYTDAGFNALYDVAYDQANARIFVVDHGATGNLIWVLPAH